MTLNTILSFCLTLLFSYNGQCTSRVSNITTDDNNISVIGDTVYELGKNIMVIYQDKKNNYWFGSFGEGLYRYDGKTILHFTTKDGLAHNRIDEILEDKAGNIYLNTSAGISKFDGQRFITIKPTSQSNHEWKLEPDDLWFKGGADSAIVSRYDGKNLHSLYFSPIKIGENVIAVYPKSLNPNMNFSPYDVYTIYKDSKGNVWFGTFVVGVCRFDGLSLNWITEEDVTELHDGPSNGVRSIIEDKDGYFWFSNSLYRYKIHDDQNGFNYTREKSIGKKDDNIDEYMSIAKDKNNELWIVTYGAGVWRYDPSAVTITGENKITHYTVKDGDDEITLFSIYKDNFGDLWLGTHEWGAYKFNGKTFERFRP